MTVIFPLNQVLFVLKLTGIAGKLGPEHLQSQRTFFPLSDLRNRFGEYSVIPNRNDEQRCEDKTQVVTNKNQPLFSGNKNSGQILYQYRYFLFDQTSLI